MRRHEKIRWVGEPPSWWSGGRIGVGSRVWIACLVIVASWAVGVIVAAITFVFGAAIESAFGLGALAGLVYAMYEYHHIVRTIERN